MAVIRERVLASDPWLRLQPAEGAALEAAPAATHLLVTLAQWRVHGDELRASGARVGVILEAQHDLEDIAADLDRLDAVAFEFGAFTEGRCYTRARMLRERYAFDGEIRAVGDVSTDRLAFMERCGFDVFELREDCDARTALSAFDELSDVYQPAADDAVTIAARRGLRSA